MISSISLPPPLHTLFPHVKHSIFLLPCYYAPLCQIIIGFSTFRYQGFCFSDTIGHRGFSFFGHCQKPRAFSCLETVRHRVFPFSDTENFLFQIPRLACWKPSEANVFLFRTPSETDVFPFSEAVVFASKDAIRHRVFPFSDKNVLIYSGA